MNPEPRDFEEKVGVNLAPTPAASPGHVVTPEEGRGVNKEPASGLANHPAQSHQEAHMRDEPQDPVADDTSVSTPDPTRGEVVTPEEDPFDPACLRINPDTASAIATRTITFTVPVRSRPDPHTFFRVHPEWHFDTYLLELKERREVYLIAPALVTELEGELKAVTIYTAIYRGGSPFIWHVALPSATGKTNDWTATAREIAQLAMTQWVRLVSDMSAGAYIARAASVPMPEPKWPDTTFSALLRKAFKEKITSLDHPVIRELQGEA